jgi:radical SAM protein with 4Fe4S-binding SPASM domain
LVQYAGAISVSRYEDRDICYDAIKRLTDAGLKQCNIHQLLATESYNQCMEVMDDYLTDVRLKSLNAIVFLALKQKGRGVHFNKLPHDSYKEIVKFALDNKIPFGSDSCNCNNLERVMIELGKDGIYNQSFEPCESVSFSIYLDVDGVTYPCSFATESAEGIDVKAVTHFLDEVWFNDITCTERKRISDNCRSCPYFDV